MSATVETTCVPAVLDVAAIVLVVALAASPSL